MSVCLFLAVPEAVLLHGLSLVVERGASSPVAVLELLSGGLLLQSTGSRVHGLQ